MGRCGFISAVYYRGHRPRMKKWSRIAAGSRRRFGAGTDWLRKAVFHMFMLFGFVYLFVMGAPIQAHAYTYYVPYGGSIEISDTGQDDTSSTYAKQHKRMPRFIFITRKVVRPEKQIRMPAGHREAWYIKAELTTSMSIQRHSRRRFTRLVADNVISTKNAFM